MRSKDIGKSSRTATVANETKQQRNWRELEISLRQIYCNNPAGKRYLE
jgi:hypothetical protein